MTLMSSRLTYSMRFAKKLQFYRFQSIPSFFWITDFIILCFLKIFGWKLWKIKTLLQNDPFWFLTVVSKIFYLSFETSWSEIGIAVTFFRRKKNIKCFCIDFTNGSTTWSDITVFAKVRKIGLTKWGRYA